MDELLVLPAPGVDTVYKAFYANVKKRPLAPWLGKKVDNAYQWMNFREASEVA